MKPTFWFFVCFSFLFSFVTASEIDINDISAKIDVSEGKIEQQGKDNVCVARGRPFTLICYYDFEIPYNFTTDLYTPNDIALQDGRYKRSNISGVVDDRKYKVKVLQIVNATENDAGTYECKVTFKVNNSLTVHTVTSLHVNVAAEPEEVENFNCISENWENLICNWSIKKNALKTTYKIIRNLPGRSRFRFNATCPIDSDIKNNTCTWSHRTIPIYRQPYELFYFVFIGVNKLGTVVFPPITFNHYANVIPARAENLQTHNVTTTSADLTWGVPYTLHNFPPGLVHKVEVQNEREPENWQIADTRLLNRKDPNLTFHFTGLKYANTLYTVRVHLKSAAADVGDKNWSPPSYITFRTAAAAATPEPEEVENFNCISENWENLTCNWSIKKNALKTTYKIMWNLPGRSRFRFNATCPIDSDIKNNTCTWSHSTTPIYRHPYELYYFVFIGVNKLGTVVFPPITFNHYANVIPARAVNLQTHNVTTTSADLTWGVPYTLHNFPPGLVHKVEVQNELEPENWQISDTRLLNRKDTNLTFHLTGLKYANTLYTVRVHLKSAAADVGDKNWSPPSYITFRTAAAATPEPEEVENFNCISENWENLTCNWSIKKNPLKTTYKIIRNLPGRSRFRFNATCPIDSDIKNNTCTWSHRTTPIYRHPYELYYFVFIGVNKLGTVVFPPITFNHYANVIPARAENLQTHNVTTTSADLTWGVPYTLHNFPPGLVHKVEVQNELETENWQISDTRLLNRKDTNLTFHLTGLKYANTLYTVRVHLKSAAADVGDKNWSPPSYITFRTAAAAATPSTEVYSSSQ